VWSRGHWLWRGQISGVYLGVVTIPGEWVRCIGKTKFFEELAIRLTTAKGVSPSLAQRGLLFSLCFIFISITSYVWAGDVYLAPDGTFVGGEPQLAPDGTFVGVESDW
jgi:hypothetical protein